ncbi:hypothetical protein ZWY2020_052727 [Hordeum vulgare]|nr:hypothetical protein ZWY2020_052727 [Hordeum vulgare]
MVATFINEAKWKEQQAKQAKVAKLKKEKFLKQNLLSLTPDALVSTQAELKNLTDKYSKLSDCKSLKSNFIKLATKAVDDYNKKDPPPAPTPQPLIEEPADESPHAEEVHQESHDETAPDPAASSKQDDDSAPTSSSKPAEGKLPRKTFLIHELKYTPRSVYRILCSVLAPIKGHDDEEDVVGLMKNILFNILHGIPINIHDFFLRTLPDNAMCPFDHKIYAPWIMRFIGTRTGINFHADCQNHVGYMPPIRVNKKTFEPTEGKGKSVIEEGSRPLDGQFREPEAYSSWDDTKTRPASPVPPRVMNTRELLLSLHQKVDRNPKRVKHHFGAIVKTLTETQNSVKLNHDYLHEVFDRTWATLAHLKTQTKLEEMDFERDFD